MCQPKRLPFRSTEDSRSCTIHCKVENHFAAKATIEALSSVRNWTKKSHVFDKEAFERLPRFDREELKLGCLLGSGGFASVFSIYSFNIANGHRSESNRSVASSSTSDSSYSTSLTDSGFGNDNALGNKTFSKYGLTEKARGYKYVVKYLKYDVVTDQTKFQVAATDLAVEAHLLSSIIHPNIIKIHGISSRGLYGFESGKEDGFFFIMDRLHNTLRQRIEFWAVVKRKNSKINFLKNNRNDHKATFKQRLAAALDVSSAMKYLHEKNIIYRDLKPENIGFDLKGNVKIFDFGLARELQPELKMSDDTYKMSGLVGSYRYMAPEVARCMPYGLSIDVYSFGILLWELCALKTPFDGYSYNKISESVLWGKQRPKTYISWPSSLRNLIKKCWSEDSGKRPSFDHITKSLEKEVSYFHHDL